MPMAGGESEAVPLRKVARVGDVAGEPTLALASRLASRFAIPRPMEAFDFLEKGNINQYTFLLEAGRTDSRYQFLLQRINRSVFTRPRAVMAAMLACLEAQRNTLRVRGDGLPSEWVPITLVPTRTGQPYLEALEPTGLECWRLMVRIPDAVTYKSLGEIKDPDERLRVAEEAGRGLAIYSDLTAGMDVDGLESPLPGYRDTALYYSQLHSALLGNRSPQQARDFIPDDPVLRHSTEQHFLVHLPEDEYQKRMKDPVVRRLVDLACTNEEFALTLAREMAAGKIRRTAIHGDTKLDNFLFDTRTGRVKALVDLDTIMPQSWLVDWGDMVRSLCNVAGEKERDIGKVQVDTSIYRSVATGFLGTTSSVTPHEIDLMVDAVQIISLELGIRFLADYIRGDSYFRLGAADPPDLNKTRAAVQLTLFERLREQSSVTRGAIQQLRPAQAATGGANGEKP